MDKVSNSKFYRAIKKSFNLLSKADGCNKAAPTG
jgi:hypothetical protein